MKALGLRNQTSIRFVTVTSNLRFELKSLNIVRHKLSGQFRWQVAMYTVAGNATDDASAAPRRDGLACQVKSTCSLRIVCMTKSKAVRLTETGPEDMTGSDGTKVDVLKDHAANP